MIDLSPIVAAALTAPIVAGLGFRLAHWLDARKAARKPDPEAAQAQAWDAAMAQFDGPRDKAVRDHKPTKPIDDARFTFTTERLRAALRAGGAPSAWRGERS